MYSSANFCCFKVNFFNFPPPASLLKNKKHLLQCFLTHYNK
nr:MAG TPA: hypothetical protein [Caudoviricetes sp.]